MEAVFGLIGVIVGSAITIAKEAWFDWKNRRQQARCSAILLVSTLNKYADECIKVVMDDGTSEGMPADPNGYRKLVIDQPEPIQYPDEIAWHSLPDTIAERALMLPDRSRKIDEQINHEAEFSDPPEYSKFFHIRRLGYAHLGLEAIALLEYLRDRYKIFKPEDNFLNPEWDGRKYLEEFIQKHGKEQPGEYP